MDMMQDYTKFITEYPEAIIYGAGAFAVGIGAGYFYENGKKAIRCISKKAHRSFSNGLGYFDESEITSDGEDNRDIKDVSKKL